MRPEPAQVLAQILTPFPRLLPLRLFVSCVPTGFRRAVAFLFSLTIFAQCIQPLVLVVLDELAVAPARGTSSLRTLCKLVHAHLLLTDIGRLVNRNHVPLNLSIIQYQPDLHPLPVRRGEGWGEG